MKNILFRDKQGNTRTCYPAAEMFNVNSQTRQLLSSRGVLLKENGEPVTNHDIILNWIIQKDIVSKGFIFIGYEE
jgi:hypothetical protein